MGGKKTYYHYEAQNMSSKVKIDDIQLKNPIKNAEVHDWDAFEEWVDYIAEDRLEASLKDHPLILVEPAIHNKEWRVKAVEMLFEKLGGNSITFFKSSVMTRYILCYITP